MRVFRGRFFWYHTRINAAMNELSSDNGLSLPVSRSWREGSLCDADVAFPSLIDEMTMVKNSLFHEIMRGIDLGFEFRKSATVISNEQGHLSQR